MQAYVRRWLVSIVSLALALALVLGLWRRDATATADSTTGQYTIVFMAENLLDRSHDTFWIPSATPAHVDVQLASVRCMNWVEITNGNNAPHNDASTQRFTVELLAGERTVWNGGGEFERVGTDTIRLYTAGACGDLLRVTVESHFAGRGCLSEISWDGR